MNEIVRTPNDMGSALRTGRKKMQLSQADVADLSGVRQETISKIENGSPGTRLDTVFNLCAALGLEIVVTNRRKGSTEFLENIF